MIGKWKKLKTCCRCKEKLKRGIFSFKEHGIASVTSVSACDKCKIAYISDHIYMRDKSRWTYNGYYSTYVKQFFPYKVYSDADKKPNVTDTNKEKKTTISQVSGGKKNNKTKTLTSAQDASEQLKEKRKKEALARIEKQQNKRIKEEMIRRENTEGSRLINNIPSSSSIINYDNIKDVWVYVYDRLSNRCSREHRNNVISYTALVPTIQSDNIRQPINVFYCKICRRYFVNSEAIVENSKKHIFFKLKYKSEYTGDDRKSFSDLTLYGYTAREGAMTEAQRQGLLKVLIDNGLMSKLDIIKQIQENINFNGRKSGNERAVERWREDLEFVQSYTKNNPTDILIRGRYIRPGNRS